jgi:mediator of RNA polymerase II transcription subunit 4
MRRGRLNAEAPLGLLGETHSVGRRKQHFLCREEFQLKIILVAPTVSPKVEANKHISGANIYRQDPHTSQLQFFDLDLDLNPDL